MSGNKLKYEFDPGSFYSTSNKRKPQKPSNKRTHSPLGQNDFFCEPIEGHPGKRIRNDGLNEWDVPGLYGPPHLNPFNKKSTKNSAFSETNKSKKFNNGYSYSEKPKPNKVPLQVVETNSKTDSKTKYFNTNVNSVSKAKNNLMSKFEAVDNNSENISKTLINSPENSRQNSAQKTINDYYKPKERILEDINISANKDENVEKNEGKRIKEDEESKNLEKKEKIEEHRKEDQVNTISKSDETRETVTSPTAKENINPCLNEIILDDIGNDIDNDIGNDISNDIGNDKDMNEMIVSPYKSIEYHSPVYLDPQKPVPMKNLGNSCYMNAIIQSIFAFPFFIDSLRNNFEKQNLEIQKDMIISKAFYDFFDTIDSIRNIRQELNYETKKVIEESQDEFKKYCGHINPNFNNYTQEDAAEFFEGIVTAIKEEFEKVKCIDFLKSFFDIRIIKSLTCVKCNKTTKIENESTHTVRLSIPKDLDQNSEFNLQTALKDYFCEESRTSDCDNCDSNEKSISVLIEKLPKILFVQLGRYNEMQQKMNVSVLAPFEIIISSKYISSDHRHLVKPSPIPTVYRIKTPYRIKSPENTKYGQQVKKVKRSLFQSIEEIDEQWDTIQKENNVNETLTSHVISTIDENNQLTTDQSTTQNVPVSKSADQIVEIQSDDPIPSDQDPETLNKIAENQSADPFDSDHKTPNLKTPDQIVQSENANTPNASDQNIAVNLAGDQTNNSIVNQDNNSIVNQQNISTRVLTPLKSDQNQCDDQRYRLAAVVCHRGKESITRGHYICYICNSKTSKWFKCDDEIINEVKFDDVIIETKEEGYCFFYVHA